MILVTGSTGNVGRHIASHPPRTGAAVRSSTRGPDTADPPAGEVGDLEQRIDSIPAQTVPKPAA